MNHTTQIYFIYLNNYTTAHLTAVSLVGIQQLEPPQKIKKFMTPQFKTLTLKTKYNSLTQKAGGSHTEVEMPVLQILFCKPHNVKQYF